MQSAPWSSRVRAPPCLCPDCRKLRVPLPIPEHQVLVLPLLLGPALHGLAVLDVNLRVLQLVVVRRLERRTQRVVGRVDCVDELWGWLGRHRLSYNTACGVIGPEGAGPYSRSLHSCPLLFNYDYDQLRPYLTFLSHGRSVQCPCASLVPLRQLVSSSCTKWCVYTGL